jgi:hypothetical protein
MIFWQYHSKATKKERKQKRLQKQKTKNPNYSSSEYCMSFGTGTYSSH